MVSSPALTAKSVASNIPPSSILEAAIPVDDYRQLAQGIDWQVFLQKCLPAQLNLDRPFKILDLACGTGRWLQTFAQQVEPQLTLPVAVRYDLLDCCGSAMSQASKRLRYPLLPGMQYLDQVQVAPLEPDAYDCVWSMHGFYAMPQADLSQIIRKIHGTLSPNGRCFIAQSTQAAFYIDFYNRFRTILNPSDSSGFTAAEDIVSVLNKLGIDYQISVLRYDECIRASDRSAVEHYILNEATVNSFNRDDAETVENVTEHSHLDQLLSHPRIKAYLESLVWDDTFHFPEEVWGISFRKSDKAYYTA